MHWNRMDIRPLNDRMVVKRVETSNSTADALFIPDSAKERPQEGPVVALSRGKRDEMGVLTPLDVAVGDHNLYGKYTGSQIKPAGEEYPIVREDEVLGVIGPSGFNAGITPGAGKPATKVA